MQKSIETIRGKKHKIPNEFSICSYLNVNTEIIFLLENDSDFSNKSIENIGNNLTGTQSNEDLIEALKSKLLDEIMPYIKIFIKELKFSKQENDLVNSNTEIIKSLEKELQFLNKNLSVKLNLQNCTRQKYSAMIKIAAKVAILILILTY